MAEIFSVLRVGPMREVYPEMQRYVAGVTRIGLRNPLKLAAPLRLNATEPTFCCRLAVLLSLSVVPVALFMVSRKYLWLYLSCDADSRPAVADLLRDERTWKNPDILLTEANRLAWLFNWPTAEPLYVQAKEFFKERGAHETKYMPESGGFVRSQRLGTGVFRAGHKDKWR
jgi:hypothetical protein